jgi:hypothetical protein
MSGPSFILCAVFNQMLLPRLIGVFHTNETQRTIHTVHWRGTAFFTTRPLGHIRVFHS